MPTTWDQQHAANDAVRLGVASEQQKEIVARMAKQSGREGNAARAAMQEGKK